MELLRQKNTKYLKARILMKNQE